MAVRTSRGNPSMSSKPWSTALGSLIPAGPAARIRNSAICWRVTPKVGENRLSEVPGMIP